MSDDSAHRLPLAPEQKVAGTESQLRNNKHAASVASQSMDVRLDVPIDMTAHPQDPESWMLQGSKTDSVT